MKNLKLWHENIMPPMVNKFHEDRIWTKNLCGKNFSHIILFANKIKDMDNQLFWFGMI